MKIAVRVVRWIFGAWFVVNGLNYFVHFFPQPMGIDPAAVGFLRELMASGLFTYVKIIEILAGALLLANRFVPLALALVLPVSAVIAFNDVLLEHDPRSFIAGVLCPSLNLFMMVGYARYYVPMLTYKASVSAGTPEPTRLGGPAGA